MYISHSQVFTKFRSSDEFEQSIYHFRLSTPMTIKCILPARRLCFRVSSWQIKINFFITFYETSSLPLRGVEFP